jgi:hypothetical protein
MATRTRSGTLSGGAAPGAASVGAEAGPWPWTGGAARRRDGADRRGAPVGQGHRRPVGLGRSGIFLDSGRDQAGPLGQARQPDQSRQRLAVDRHRHRPPHRRIGQRALARGEGEAEQAAGRIESERRGRWIGGLDDRQVADRTADHQIGPAGLETGNGARRPFAAQRDAGQARAGFLVLAALRLEHDHAPFGPRQAIGAGAGTGFDDRHFGMGEQLQEIGPRPPQADLQHLVGHRDDVVDRAEHRLQRVAACPAQRRAEPRHDLLRRDPAAAGPVGAADAEGVAKPVVGDDPALRQRRLDLAGGVEPHQALGDGFGEIGGGRIERPQIGVGQPWRPADRADRDRPGLLLAAAGQAAGEGGEARTEEYSKRRHSFDGPASLSPLLPAAARNASRPRAASSFTALSFLGGINGRS